MPPHTVVALDGDIRGKIVRVGRGDLAVAEVEVRGRRGAPLAIGDLVRIDQGGTADPGHGPFGRVHVPEVVPVTLALLMNLLLR